MKEVKKYKTKTKAYSGTSYSEISRKAYREYNDIKKKSKRRPYIRSTYFKKDKIFLELFWRHLQDKDNFRDKVRRIKYFPCAVELINKSCSIPEVKENPDDPSEVLYRFWGAAPNGVEFIVQIKEKKKSGRKWLISVFPK